MLDFAAAIAIRSIIPRPQLLLLTTHADLSVHTPTTCRVPFQIPFTCTYKSASELLLPSEKLLRLTNGYTPDRWPDFLLEHSASFFMLRSCCCFPARFGTLQSLKISGKTIDKPAASPEPSEWERGSFLLCLSMMMSSLTMRWWTPIHTEDCPSD